MKQFAFVQKKHLSNIYGSFLHRYRKYDGIADILKIWLLSVGLLVCALSYLYFINMSSTRGYFLRQENQKLSAISFQFEILKTRMLDYQQQNWNAVQSSTLNNAVVDVASEVVEVPSKVELGMK